MSTSKFIPTPLAAMASMAGPDAGAAQFGYQRASEGPLCRMLRGEPALPDIPHYNAAAPGIAGLLGEVDQRLIEDAMAERPGATLH